jgi:4-hydroxy-tetrahydrodipicolinate synthase
MTTHVCGAYTVLVTPFTPSGEVDYEGLRHNIRFQIEEGIEGLVALGTTGEAPTLTHSEKEKVVHILVEEACGKVDILVGTGSYSTQQTIENTLLAKQWGANGALIVTPYYNKPTQEGLYRHFKAIAEAVDLPLILYNVQGRTGQNLQTETLKRLSKIPSIIGVKECSGNLVQIMEVMEAVSHRPDFSIMSGDDILTFPIMALGGHGIFSVVGNLFPRAIKELVQYLQDGDFESARRLHYQLMPIFQGAFIETNPIPIKSAMNLHGLPAGGCRLPLCEMMPENLNKLQNILKNLSFTSCCAEN